MENALIAILESFKYPVIRQGSLPASKAYDPTFITWWNTAEDGMSFYDNEAEGLVVYEYDVNVYSESPNMAYSLLYDIRAALKSAGWIILSRGYDVASDEPTHTGRGMHVAFLATE